MRNTARQTRENRTITVDFQNEATYFQLLGDGKAFVECVLAFLLALGFQLTHKATCQWRRVPDAPLALCPCPPGWAHHLACPVHHVQSGVHGPAALRLALSPDAPGGGPRCPVGDAWRTQFGAVRGDLAYLAHGALSPGLCVWPPESGDGADPVWSAPARLFPGRREAQPLSH